DKCIINFKEINEIILKTVPLEVVLLYLVLSYYEVTPPDSIPLRLDFGGGCIQTGGIIDDLDADKDVTLEEVEVEKNAEVLSMQDDVEDPAELQVVIEVVTTTKLMTEIVTGTTTTIRAAAPITAATIIAASTAARRRKEDDVIEQVKEKGKQDNTVLRYQELKRKPQTEAHARKNMMVYLKNMVGFKMDYFKGMSYDAIRPIFKKYFNSNVCFLEKSKEQLEEEESRALKRQIVSNDDDDVYTEATPLALKVHVVDYEIYTENNKPYYKIIRADESHQLFLSFLSLLRNFDREDLEMLWQIAQDRFAYSKPKNFLDDFLLTTLKYMFEKPDVEAQV
nr:hypothetical protein [Tanacetum cinerariifolium]